MAGLKRNKLLAERPLPRDGRERRATRKAARSVTVNLAESPLGWLLARGMVTRRQYEAGERLRADRERAQLAPSVTIRWDAPPAGKAPRGAARRSDPTTAQVAAKLRFEAAADAVEAGLADILWRIICAGEGMRDAEVALGWPARAGRVVLVWLSTAWPIITGSHEGRVCAMLLPRGGKRAPGRAGLCG